MKLANPESAATYFRVTRRSRLFVRTGSIAIASFLTACFFPAVADQHERSQDPAPIKRALLVGIGSYAPGTNWGDLASLGDLEIMQDALLQQEFAAENIKTVTSPNATRRDIVDAFKNTPDRQGGKGRHSCVPLFRSRTPNT